MTTLRCTEVAREAGLAPLGTAGHYGGFLLVDWPLPWPADVGDIPELTEVNAAAKAAGVRVQAVAPSGDAARVVLYRRPEGTGFAGYDRAARVAEPASVVAAALGLLAGDGGDRAGDGDGDAAGGIGDILVCGHGRRDPCCGRDGTLLAMELLADPVLRDAGYAVGRTSHTGGHRFAPTAIVLPQGTMWAYLDRELTARILHRTGPVAGVLPHYRGSTGIGSPGLQALERQAFAEVGWGWLDWRREGREVADGVVTLAAESPTGARAAWEAVVASEPRPVPDCGKPLAEARKESPEPAIVAWRRTV
jgi:hypothetical protein